MTAETARALAEAFAVPSGESRPGVPVKVYNATLSIKIEGKETGGRFCIMEDLAIPKGGPPLHVHHREDEAFYVLEGRYVFEVDGHRIAAGPGDFVWAPRDIPHTYQNVSEANGRVLVFISPSGLEDCFREVAALPGPPTEGAAIPIFVKYGIELLGPPLSAR